ncbi:zinc finger, CCHC-type containing protein [Tanacetum coccineum]|uniref:Zinc finger, CCHC-type containing protein n=1 Tax=Tanacetum coccineum TaxID=301880 RepID=A0ABQ4XA31_9ASTR
MQGDQCNGVEEINEVENGAGNKSIKTSESEEVEEAPGSQPVSYYLKHKINEKLINGLVNNNRFNNSRSRTQAGKKKGKEYKVLPGGPAYDAILKKKITKKEDIGGNFEIPCNIGNLKHVNALVDQGSDVNVMPYSTYMKLTDKRPTETDIRLSLASHLYIYPLGITYDVLVEITEHVYPIDFVILDIRENENRPFILGTPFLTTAKASIKFDTGTITLRSGKHKVSFHRIPDSSNVTDKRVKNNIEPIAPTMTVNRVVLEWEEKIKLNLEREMQFNQWRSKNFKGMHPTLIATKEGMDDVGEVTGGGLILYQAYGNLYAMTGLESVEARLAHYKKNEAVFEESINVLKLEVRLRDNALDEYKMKLDKAEKERDQLKQTLEKFQNSSKSLNDLLESQVIDKFKTGLGYNAATHAVESFVNLSDKSGSDKG